MNLPNRLTFSRLILAALFVGALESGWAWTRSAALVLFGAAALTDWADGRIARRTGLETDFGRLMDPLADKILTAAAFICLVPHRLVPAWVAVLIISREFLVTGLRLLASAKGRILAAERLGKHKTAWQMVTLVFLLALLAGREIAGGGAIAGPEPAWFSVGRDGVGNPLLGLTVFLTAVSGLGYLWRQRDLIAPATPAGDGR